MFFPTLVHGTVLTILILPFVCNGHYEKEIAANSPRCMDDNGRSVDWWIVYKLPYIKGDKSGLFTGSQYAVITSRQQADGWRLSKQKIASSKSIFGLTLQPYFSENRSKYTSMFYSDQPPDNKDVPSSFAHAKGIVLSDSERGIWFIHTIPKFVSNEEKKYAYPNNGYRFGQVAMCISLSVAELTKVISQNFLLSRPYVYQLYIDPLSETKDLGKALIQLEHRNWTKNLSNELKLKSAGGQEFMSIYKSPKLKVDLYDGLVAPFVKASLRVETWRHPPGNPLHSNCTLQRAEVENIERIKLKFADSKLTGSFSSYNDHSKWAITRDKKTSTVCVGDMNRVQSQFSRGGGTTCITDDKIWKDFDTLVEKIERCPDDPISSTEKPDEYESIENSIEIIGNKNDEYTIIN